MSSAAAVLERTHETLLKTPPDTLGQHRISVTLDESLGLPLESDGLIIDRRATEKPEDLVCGIDTVGLGPVVARSIVDFRELDPELETMRQLLLQLERGENPDRVFPRRRHYGFNRSVRSITTPFCTTDRRQVLSSGPQIHYVRGERYTPMQRSLHGDPRYQLVEEAVHTAVGRRPHYGGRLDRDEQRLHRGRNAQNTVMFSNDIANAIMMKWASERGVVQITSAPPKLVKIGGKEIEVASYVPTTGDDVRYGAEEVEYGGPGRKRAALWNLLSISYAREHGEPPFTLEEGKLYAGWLTRRKIDRRARELGLAVTT